MSAPGTRVPVVPRGHAVSAVTVEEMGHRGAFRALAAAWESLARRAGCAGPFFHPYWFAVYAGALDRDRPRAVAASEDEPPRLRLLVAHRRGALAGVLPLVAERRRISGVPARVLRSLGDDHSQRFDVVVDGDEAAHALFRYLAADRGWDVLELRDLPPGCGADRLLHHAHAAGFPTGRYRSQVSPWLPLPTSTAALEQALDAKFRANLRRRAKRLAEVAGPLSLERIEGRRDLDAALEDGFALEASGWKGRLGTAIARDPSLRRRYRALAHVFAARGELALYFLRAGDRRVAFHFAIESGGVYYLFKPGYDEALARFGPGHLLLREVALALVGRGVREIDLLGDDMPWKRCWTDRARAHSFGYVMRPTPRGRALGAWKFDVLPIARQLLEEARLRLRPLDETAPSTEGDPP